MTEPTFEQRQRRFYDHALVAAGVSVGLCALLIVAVLTWGGWPEDLYGQIVAILGKALMGAGVVMVFVIVFLGLGGPVRRLKAAFGKASIETEGD